MKTKLQKWESVTLTNRDGSTATYDIAEKGSVVVAVVNPTEQTEKGTVANCKIHASTSAGALDTIIDALQAKLAQMLGENDPTIGALMSILNMLEGKRN